MKEEERRGVRLVTRKKKECLKERIGGWKRKKEEEMEAKKEL